MWQLEVCFTHLANLVRIIMWKWHSSDHECLLYTVAMLSARLQALCDLVASG